MSGFRFFVGLHQPSDAQHFSRSMISINRIRERRSPFAVGEWIMDSGAFTEVAKHGGYRQDVASYAEAARRWIGNGDLVAIIAQDWMCEPFVVARTGLSVREHQLRTVERYDRLLQCGLDTHVMPVIQGFGPDDYRRHLDDYGDRLTHGLWAGVGSVCKRNGSPVDVVNVLGSIAMERPDLRLHGFGLKKTSLQHAGVRSLLESADSMAWSFSARKQGRNPNDWREAAAFERTVLNAALGAAEPWQITLRLDAA